MVSYVLSIFYMHTLNKDEELIMVKKIAITLLCIVLGSSLYARDDISQSKPFIGLEIGYATLNADASNYFSPFVYPGYESSDIEYGFRIGAQKDDWRTMLIFNYFDTENDDYSQNYYKGFLSLDYLFSVSDGEEKAFKPYLGLNIGYISYETGDTPNKLDASGFIYGAQAGFIFSVSEKIDIDLMYRYSLGYDITDDLDIERVDNIGSVILGINYLY